MEIAQGSIPGAEPMPMSVLGSRLGEIDPQAASRIKPTDPQRILRALEIYHLSGQPMSTLLRQASDKPDVDFKRLILDVVDRKALHQRIALRFQLMLEQGFEQEVEALRARGDLNLQMPSMRCVGYRQMWLYLQGNYTRAEMVEKAVVATRQLAKRQLTWLRKYEQVKRLDYRDFSLDEVYDYILVNQKRA